MFVFVAWRLVQKKCAGLVAIEFIDFFLSSTSSYVQNVSSLLCSERVMIVVLWSVPGHVYASDSKYKMVVSCLFRVRADNSCVAVTSY